MKFKEKIFRMMYGRYGTDNLNNFIMILSFILIAINLFLSWFVLSVITLVLLILSILRTFSKNIPARQRENARYLKISKPITGKFKLLKNKFRDRKTHVYKKCPKCKSVLRLPKKKGNHTVSCPKCRERFDVKI